ncbi:protein kinase [Streptomyces sp. NBC_00638]|uniref:serine/threonine-protein kinase n=1 Tax=Streptomyces sp. NBC_00638 TaxID=2975794 RepID=UPI00338FD213
MWRAADEILDRQVAVKEMRIDGLDPEDTRTRRERTLREARATARIDHPHVVRIYDVVDAGERLWIVMELVTGRSLEQIVVEDGPLDSREAARVGLELVGALRQVHAQGVLHRDIKPGNVLVEHAGRHRVVLTDFGIAALQDAEALTMAGMLVGSPDYMAPERISGRPQGPPSDVWSLGATLCAALGGRSPFSRSTTLATLHAVLYEEPELPAGAGELQEILAALLEKDPSTRPGLEELEAGLREILRPPRTSTAPFGSPAEGPDYDFASGFAYGTAHETPHRPTPAHNPEPAPEPGPDHDPGPERAPGIEPAPGYEGTPGGDGAPGSHEGEPERGGAPRREGKPGREPAQARAGEAAHGGEAGREGAPRWREPAPGPEPAPGGDGAPGSHEGEPGRGGAPRREGEAGRESAQARAGEAAHGGEAGLDSAPGRREGEPGNEPAPGHEGKAGPRDRPEPAPRPYPTPRPATEFSPAHQPAPQPERLPELTPDQAYDADPEPTSGRAPDPAPEPPPGPEPPPAPGAPPEADRDQPHPGHDLRKSSAPASGHGLTDSATPALLDAQLVRAARQPPADLPGATPPPDERHINPSDPRRPPTRPEAEAEAVPGPGPGPGTEPGTEAGPGTGPGTGPGPEAGPGTGPRPGLEAEAGPGPGPEAEAGPGPGPGPGREPEYHSVQDAVPIQRTPTRKSAPDFRKRPQAPVPEHSAVPGPEAVTRDPDLPATANASTEVPSGPRTEPSSQTPSEQRSEQRSEHGSRPVSQLPTAPVPVVRSPGELPGPAVPSGSDEGQGYGPYGQGRRQGHGDDLGARAASRRGGRRIGLATAAAVAAGAVAWVVVALTGGSPGTGNGASPRSSAPTAAASTGASSSPAPTVEGTSRPPGPPPGARREAGGYAWVTPKGWRRDLKTGSEVHYTSPDGAQELAAKSSIAKGNLMDTWQTSEKDARQGRDYRKIRLEETTFRGRKAIVWEYTFTLEGVSWHARLLGFDADGKSYQINTWYHRDIEDQALKVYNQVKNSFTVL